jgi:hypothetical protein
MALEATMRDALDARPDVEALACMDGSAGLLLGMYVRGDVPHELVELAALSAPDLCRSPELDDAASAGPGSPDAFVASDSWVHAFARVPNRPELVVMGLAPRGANVALLRSWLGEVAARFGALA